MLAHKFNSLSIRILDHCSKLKLKMTEQTSQTPSKPIKRRILFAAVGISVLAAIVAVIAVLTTRPKNLEVTESKAVESLPSLIKGVSIGSGTIGIEFTESFEDMSTLFYYVSLDGDLDVSFIEEELGLENPSLYLVRDLESMDSLLRIGSVNDVIFPFKLSDSFLPGDFEGLLLTEEEPANSDDKFVASFLIVDASRDIATPTKAPVATNNPTRAPTVSPVPTIRGATRVPTASPTREPTLAPVSPTSAPVAALVGNLEGDSYNIAGTITIDSVAGIEGGQAVSIARLQFDVNAVSAPGPYLYLSKRPFSETRDGRLVAEDIEIEIDGVENGSFTKGGVFEQVFDEIDDVQDLREYEGGSFIVWCRPFGVWLGGGPIQTSNN